MTTHFGVIVLFAVCVTIVFGTLGRDEARRSVRLASRCWASSSLGAYLVGWLMFALIR